MPLATEQTDLRDPPRVWLPDGKLAIPSMVCELCGSAEFYAANTAARDDLEMRLATPLNPRMLSDASDPNYITRDDLFCNMGSTFEHTRGVQPQHFRVWALHTKAEIEEARLQLREGASEVPGTINVESLIDHFISRHCAPNGALSDRAIFAVASAGLSSKIDAICIGYVQPRIDPDEHELAYWVHVDLLYTRPSRRGRGAATAAAWLLNDRIEDDLYALDDKIAAFGGEWTLETKLFGDIFHRGAECIFDLFEATLKDFQISNFESASHWAEWGW